MVKIVTSAVVTLLLLIASLGMAAAEEAPLQVLNPDNSPPPAPERNHNCIHGTPAIQRLVYDGLDRIAPQHHADDTETLAEGTGRRKQDTQATNSIRIVISTLDLDDTSKFCTAAGDVRPDMKGGSVTCTSDDVFTSDRKNILLTNVIPTALAKIGNLLYVNRLTSNLIVPSTSTCSPFTIPNTHTTTGVANADFVLYVSAAPSTAGNLAWAGFCALDTNGRPVIGRANFAPKYINWSTTDTSVNDDQVATAVHELTHALGFSPSLFKQKTTVSLRGKTATLLTSPEVVTQVRAYFGCDTLQGGEIEDEGGSGSAGAHWDRRVLKDEMMAAAGGAIYSVMTLAHMKDLGFYDVDYGLAETMTWAKGAGCEFSTEKCNTAAGGKDVYFCFDNSKDSCVETYNAVGYCPIYTYSSDLPTYFQYFADPKVGGDEFFDKCPVPSAYGNRWCNRAQTVTSSQQTFGWYFGAGGKCFDTTGLLQSGFSAPGASTLRCLQSRCKTGPLRIEVQVNNGGWRQCPTDGSAGSVTAGSGWQGSIICPKASDFCTTDIIIGATTAVPPVRSTEAPTFGGTSAPTTTLAPGATSAPTTAAPPPTPRPPTPAPPTAPVTPIPTSVVEFPVDSGSATIQGTITISGTKATWSSILALSSGTAAVRNAIRRDLGDFLTINPTAISITSLTAGSLIVEYQMIGVNSVTADELHSILDAQLGQSSWLTNTQAVFATASSGETISLSGNTASKVDNSGICGTGYSSNECIIIIVVSAAGGAVLIFVAIVVYCCCCRGGAEEAKPQSFTAIVPRGNQPGIRMMASTRPARGEPYQ